MYIWVACCKGRSEGASSNTHIPLVVSDRSHILRRVSAQSYKPRCQCSVSSFSLARSVLNLHNSVKGGNTSNFFLQFLVFSVLNFQ